MEGKGEGGNPLNVRWRYALRAVPLTGSGRQRATESALETTAPDPELVGGAGFQPANRPPTGHRLEAGTTGIVIVDASQGLQDNIDLMAEFALMWRAKRACVIGASNQRAAWVSRPRAGSPAIDPGELEFLAVDAQLRRSGGR